MARASKAEVRKTQSKRERKEGVVGRTGPSEKVAGRTVKEKTDSGKHPGREERDLKTLSMEFNLFLLWATYSHSGISSGLGPGPASESRALGTKFKGKGQKPQ